MRHIYADFIQQVAKPSRYLGGEYLSVVKDPESIRGRIALAFPDVYEIGMSHMGTKILYSQLNKREGVQAERCFAPWVDMEEELRQRELPLVSLETQRSLCDFDVVGISLQYELTYSNVLTLLDLGGIPLRSRDRSMDAPLVIGGGPCATHPEPVAPFFDAFFIGEAEASLPELVLDWAEMRRQGRERADALAELASRYSVYVPSLYGEETCSETGQTVVGRPLDPRVPSRVTRSMIEDIDAYPFPNDTPVPYAEAVFDRAGVEIARGCTEGCRFCQAGMIYRPVRERSPEAIVDSVLQGVEKAGYDETSLTSLSTADYSCITPLVKRVMGELRERKVSLSVSSLRAYGLGEEILDEMASMRITGLTFAPEAGTQRMRDVVNKNVTEAHIEESTHRIFKRGWNRLKLYFMIGLPTEQDDDVFGIVETGQRMLRIGRTYVAKRAEVTVSVSSHVPKPHTPFQWCAQDTLAEIKRKQSLLRDTVSERGLKLKVHDSGVSWVEGVFARGDRRLADAIESAWRAGARFDGWDELFDQARWEEAFSDHGIDAAAYLGTRPVSARLPWDHIDVGLDDGFLLREYRKALASRLSPPCGKVVGQLVHPSSLRDASEQRGKLVCYDCGVACDLTQMRDERATYLRLLGAEEPSPSRETPVRIQLRGSRGGKGAPKPNPAFPQRPGRRMRVRYAKVGRSAFLGHLDTSRVIMRLFRRAGIELAYTRGFHPKPNMQFTPALSLGIPSLGEIMDLVVEGTPSAEEVFTRLQEVSPDGLIFTGVWELPDSARKLSKLVGAYDLVIAPAPDGIVYDASRLGRIAKNFEGRRQVLVDRGERQIDVRALASEVEVLTGDIAAKLCQALDWEEAPALLRVRIEMAPDGSAKPTEVARALGIAGTGDPATVPARIARLGFVGLEREHRAFAGGPVASAVLA